MPAYNVTENGHAMGEATSAMQKCIRRGLEREAMYWAMELERRYPYYVWHRLEVISNEDIGPANPQVIVLVHTLKEQYFAMRDRPGQASEMLCLANAILALCRSPKSRLADNFLTVIDQERQQNKLRLEVPDYALDKHTGRGRKKGRGWEFFNKVSSHIENETTEFEDIYKEEGEELRMTFDSSHHKNRHLKSSTDKPRKNGKNGGSHCDPDAPSLF